MRCVCVRVGVGGCVKSVCVYVDGWVVCRCG